MQARSHEFHLGHEFKYDADSKTFSLKLEGLDPDANKGLIEFLASDANKASSVEALLAKLLHASLEKIGLLAHDASPFRAFLRDTIAIKYEPMPYDPFLQKVLELVRNALTHRENSPEFFSIKVDAGKDEFEEKMKLVDNPSLNLLFRLQRTIVSITGTNRYNEGGKFSGRKGTDWASLKKTLEELIEEHMRAKPLDEKKKESYLSHISPPKKFPSPISRSLSPGPGSSSFLSVTPPSPLSEPSPRSLSPSAPSPTLSEPSPRSLSPSPTLLSRPRRGSFLGDEPITAKLAADESKKAVEEIINEYRKDKNQSIPPP